MKTDDAGTSTGRALVAIGTNVPFHDLAGPALVAAALRRLDDEGLAPLAVSTCRTTEAWPDPSDPPFTNAAALLHAPGLPAQAVLQVLLRVEAAFGRIRSERNAPRTLDLDLLDLDGQILDEVGLELPHPRLHARAFVLEPLAEIAPGWRHPVSGRTALEMWAALTGRP
jgi:2-amino-4-hydroxy-6-hydroxymethyldihydropteridine diphosphokinase